MKPISTTDLVIVVVGLVLLAASPAHAYIDPAAGSLALQILIGAALGAMLAIKLCWHQIKSMVGRLFGRGPAKSTKSPADIPGAKEEASSQTEAPIGTEMSAQGVTQAASTSKEGVADSGSD